MRVRRQHKGYTMLEMMVSIGIGMIVSLAATQLFLTNQMSFNLQKGLGDVSDNGRFALDFMGRAIRAGAMQPMPANATANTNNIALAGAMWPAIIVDSSDFPNGVTIPDNMLSKNNQPALAAPATGKQGGIGASDQLLVQYYAPYDTRDCEGQTVPAGNYVLARFFLRADTSAGTGSALACEGGYYAGTENAALVNISTTDTGGAVMLSSVDNFQVMVGTASATGATAPQQYMNLATYKALPTPRPPIATVKLGLLVSSIERAGTLLGASPAFTVLDETVAAGSIPADNRVRRLFSSTVTVRNVMN